MEPISIEIKSDGVYLNIVIDDEKNRPSRMEVLKVVEDNGIKDIDFSAINEIFKTNELYISQKISSNTEIKSDPEEMIVTIGQGYLEATVMFKKPTSIHGHTLTYQEIKNKLEEANVRYGIMDDVIRGLAEHKEYGKHYVVACGIKPTEGQDGYLKMHFETKKSRKPKELEGGRVDYHNLDLIEMATAGDVLVTSHEEKPGIDGMDVRNIPIPAKRVKKPAPLPRGKSTSISTDGTKLISEINGQIVYESGRVNVYPVLNILSDIDNTTGDIHFNGAVNIKGNVLTGFTVEADGAIEIKGVVEGAAIKSKENITIVGGVQGLDKAVIEAEGNIYLKFAEQCTLSSGGDIYADNIMHSNVKCGGNLELKGKAGLLVGGKSIVGGIVRSVNIGSKMATVTEIETGFNPDTLISYKQAMTEYNLNKAEYDKMSTIVESLNAQNKIEPLDEDKKRILLKTVHTKMFLREKLIKSQERVQNIAPILLQSQGAVYASGVVRSGVKVTIGNATMYIRDDIEYCRLTNVDSKIQISPFE